MNKLLLACAGAGKSRRITEVAHEQAENGKSVLVLTYTESNQNELLKKLCKKSGALPGNISIKGWFSFLLDDYVRPYQNCIFEKRVSGINFSQSDPHRRNGYTIRGRSEKIGENYNALHYLTKQDSRAHTLFLSKLSVRINKESGGKVASRLRDSYDYILIDEAQDLVGWDYNALDILAKISELEVLCVGDFRQTIYSTAPMTKMPKTNKQKLLAFENMGFKKENMNECWRCIQPVCDLADLVHKSDGAYPKTESKVSARAKNGDLHYGVFSVSEEDASAYIKKIRPTILRLNRSTQKELCEGQNVFNFGESKGLGFSHVLIIPTAKQKSFLSGDLSVFKNEKTERARSAFYVAMTRAKYSLAFLSEEASLDGITKWANID